MNPFRISVAAALTLCAVSPPASAAEEIDCELSFNLSGWSLFYKTASGTGTITCDNGQSLPVTISAEGGGITFGKSSIENGVGKFSDVVDIEQTLGSYASAEAHAGATKSAKAIVATKGEVSLLLSGTGQGWDVGVGFGKFTIERAGAGK